VKASSLDLNDLKVGQEFSFNLHIEEADIDRFAVLSGDLNPLHMNKAFAESRGFKSRVVHGAYLLALVSRLLGMHLPGANCLLQTMQMKFAAPTYVGDSIRINGTIDHISVAVKSVVVRLTIARAMTDEVLASGKASLGFTQV
jgi:3-hydroxybutyryl-CoA dehydratase